MLKCKDGGCYVFDRHAADDGTRGSRCSARCGSALNMNQTVEIGWGRSPRAISVSKDATVLHPKTHTAARDCAQALSASLENPIGSKPLVKRLKDAGSVCILVPDHTRKNVTDLVLPTLLGLIGHGSYSVGVATGKHPVYSAPDHADWVHDAHSESLRAVGTTARGTVVRFPFHVLEADLRILIGEIRPHYFTGYSGGAKTLFPGVAGADGIWSNHELKAKPGARIGVISGNPCRMDMEEAAAMAGPSFIINIVRAASGEPLGFVSGDPVEAHRAGVLLAREYFEMPVAHQADVVVVSDRCPVTMNLYQACKLLPPAGAILADGGTIIVAAECGDGLGPVEIINQKIYELGVIHSLPDRHRVILVSSCSAGEVEQTFAEYAPSVEAALNSVKADRVTILPYGGEVIPTLKQHSF